VIPGGGRVLMAGLIDAHAHVSLSSIPIAAMMRADPGYIAVQGALAAGETLLCGFTSVRDAGGPVFGIKQAVDQGLIPGPRIYPSGAFISQTAGHGDFRMPHETPRGIAGHLAHAEIGGPRPSPTAWTRCCGRPASSSCTVPARSR
jgi:imidazolonepropionase-like amidohydrolase